MKFWKSSGEDKAPGAKLAHHITTTRSWGCIGRLTSEQRETLQKLRPQFAENVAACVSEAPAAYCEAESNEFAIGGTAATEVDAFLLRFLKARNFDAEKTTLMLSTFFQWRILAKVPQIIKDVRFPWMRLARQLYPHNYFGVDKLGRPIFIDRVGKSDPKKLLHAIPLDHLLAYWVQQYEYLRSVVMPACSIRAGKRIDQGLTIVDLSGLKMSHFNSSSRSVMRKLATITQDYYPEMLGAMIVVNAPTVFGPIWSFAKGLLDEATVAKISLMTSRSSHWKEALQVVVDPDQLPLFLGGTQPDEGWETRCLGPWEDPDILAEVKRRQPGLPDDFVHLTVDDGDADSLSVLQGSEPVSPTAHDASFDSAKEEESDEVEEDSAGR